MTDAREHWQTVYREKSPDKVSWFQPELRVSHSLIARAAGSLDACIMDVGGGASTLVDTLLAAGYTNIAVLDWATSALESAQMRLGANAARARWLAGDVLTFAFPASSIDVWHDRAVFHFLTRPEDRARYIAQVKRAVRPGGHVLIATFAEDGPVRCSGLPVERYSASELHGVFGPGFILEASVREDHTTPTGAHQAFTYCLCRWAPDPLVRTAA